MVDLLGSKDAFRPNRRPEGVSSPRSGEAGGRRIWSICVSVSDGASASAPERSAPDGDDPARITWIGHSTVLLELGGVRLATDPVLRSRVTHLRRVSAPARELADLDAVLISHVHYDHLDLPSLRRVRGVECIVVPRGAGR